MQCQTPITTRFCVHCGHCVQQPSLFVDTALHTAPALTYINGHWRRTLRDLYLRPGLLLDRYLTTERQSSLLNELVNFSGYLAILSNMLTATLAKWLYPTASWSDRFMLLTYAAVFAGIHALPLGLLAAALQYDVNNWLICCGQLTCVGCFGTFNARCHRQ